MTATPPAPRRVCIVLFEGFELLDVFGPAELFGLVPQVSVEYVGPQPGPVTSSHGAQVVADLAYADLAQPGILLVPGGQGTRRLVHDQEFLPWLRHVAGTAQILASVCTGSALLAAAGLLEGHQATSNKRAFTWAAGFGTHVDWKAQSRWVQDRNRWTSSGVAAGMDMTAALITELHGEAVAEAATRRAEYEPHTDSSRDPFAARHGLS